MGVHDSSENSELQYTDCFVGALDAGGKHSTTLDHTSLRLLLIKVIAHGIIVPLLYTAQDAQKLVQSAKFPPLGNRGFGS